MQPTRNTLSENIRAQSVGLLNKHLAAAIDLQAQMKQAHWNVRGPGFIAIHTLFDKVADEAAGYADSSPNAPAAWAGQRRAPSDRHGTHLPHALPVRNR